MEIKDFLLYNGDCLEILPELKEHSIDAVIADPPYGTTINTWDSIIPIEPLWKKLKYVVNSHGAIVLFSTQPFTSLLITSNIRNYKCEWIWHKNTGGNPGILKYHPNKTHENIIVFGYDTVVYNPQRQLSISKQAISNANAGKTIKRQGSKSNHITNDSTFGTQDGAWNAYVLPTTVQKFNTVPKAIKRLHTSQKPVELMEYLIKTYTNEGDVVLDFCMGSGTTGVACANTNRRFIGIEKDATYFNIAQERIVKAYGKER